MTINHVGSNGSCILLHMCVDHTKMWIEFDALERNAVQMLVHLSIWKKSQNIQPQCVESDFAGSVKSVRSYNKWTPRDHEMIKWFQDLEPDVRPFGVSEFVARCLPTHTVPSYYAETKKLKRQKGALLKA